MQSKDVIITIHKDDPITPALPEKNGYVSIPDNTTYVILIRNTSSSDGTAEISIDGTSIGDFKVYGDDHIVVRRPSIRDESLVFRSEESIKEAASNVIGKEHNGLIVVKWEQESAAMKDSFKGIIFGSRGLNNNQSFCMSTSIDRPSRAGMTTLGPATGQRYKTVSGLYSIDDEKSTRVSLRLVLPESVRPLQTNLNMDPPRI
ncbi:MAG: hypothetical protein EOP45_05420 [Sphingobacteriaceae bacterium]|nr:MAG: hypothetical protein EOP45_05420 [Sphingobacteriaceae bacterium]